MKIETAAPQPCLLTVKDAARYLSVTVWFVRGELIYKNRCRHIKLGNRYVFSIADLDAFVAKELRAA